MQVESSFPHGLYHAHPPPITHPNGAHLDSKPNYSPSTTSHSREREMHPYQQQQPQPHYAGPPPGSQQRQYAANQLPPLHPVMNISPMPGQPGPSGPGPSNVPPGPVYNASPSYAPPPALNTQRSEDFRKPFVGCNGKYNFELQILQQPQRARMCGFGDKDRRPITPPPCIKLVITDMSGNTVGTPSIDGSFFVLQVDLHDGEQAREANVVRNPTTSSTASISTATTTSYPPLPDRPPVQAPQPPSDHAVVMYNHNGQPVFHHPSGYPPSAGMQHYSSMGYGPSPYSMPGGPTQQYHHGSVSSQAQNHSNAPGMYTRNLIGSLTVNASILKDPEGNEAYWFVLQDLSVRTEGWFRLKMQFFDLAAPSGEGLNRGISPALAQVYSEPFQVYSAKKFPGVIESTVLSKCFAAQGIKIPIRKDMKMEEVPADEED